LSKPSCKPAYELIDVQQQHLHALTAGDPAGDVCCEEAELRGAAEAVKKELQLLRLFA